MAKTKSTKRALLSSVLALVLCVSMLIGSTFAWFTDSVESTGNIIKSGTLDVEMMWADGKAAPDAADTVWTDASKGPIFKSELWEPGYTEVRHIKIKNAGTLALKYQVSIAANGVVSKLADVIDVYYLDPAEAIADRAALADEKPMSNLTGALAGLATGGNGNLKAGEEVIVTIALKMRESAGNEYQDLSIGSDFAIKLFATQYTYEPDSFDDQYDVFADYDGEISNAVSLAAAFANGGTYKLVSNIALDSAAVVPAGATVNLDLDGKTITSSATAIENNGTMLIANGTLKNTTVNGDAVVINKGKMVLDDASIIGAPIGETGYPAYALNNSGDMTIEEGTNVSSDRGAFVIKGNGTTTINGGVFTNNDIDRTLTSHVVDLSDDATEHTLIINGGTFQHLFDETSGGVVICNRTKNTVYVNGGNFSGGNYYGNNNLSDYGYGGTFSVTGGTYTAKPADKYIADGYAAVANGDGTYTVLLAPESGATLSAVAGYNGLYTDGTNYYVYDAVGLISMRDFWKANWCGNNMWGRSYNVMADINAQGYTWDNVWVNVGSNANDGFVLDGHGNTITGLTINGSMFSGNPNGGNAGTEPGKVVDLTFDDVTVIGDHWTAVVWGNTYGEIVFENVHVLNSTITGKCNTAAFVGGTAQESGDVTVNFKNCSVKNTAITANGTFSGVEGDWASDPTGASVYMSRAFCDANLTFEGCVSEGNTVKNGDGLVGGGIYAYTALSNGWWIGTGACDSFTNWNGITVAAEGQTLADAINSGASEVVLGAGTYKLPDEVKNKTLTIAGTKDTKIDVSNGLTYINGATLTLEGVTVQSKPDGAGYNNGFADAKKATLNNCVINGTLGLDFTTEFNKCEFNISGNYYNIWTWGAGTATFNGCTFNCDGKAMLVYANVLDNNSNHQTVNITDCIFNDNGDDTVTGKAAIEITNTYTPVRTYDVIIKNTTVNGFAQTVPGAGDFNAAYGSVAGSDIGTNVWGNKCELPNTQINVVIDGVDVY